MGELVSLVKNREFHVVCCPNNIKSGSMTHGLVKMGTQICIMEVGIYGVVWMVQGLRNMREMMMCVMP